MTYIWKYSDKKGSTVQHAFYNSRINTSLCGWTLPWYVPQVWNEDEEGLKQRKKCKRCIYVAKVNDHSATPQDHHGVARHAPR